MHDHMQPDSHEPTHGNAAHSAYHGLVRAVVRVTSTAGLSGYERASARPRDGAASHKYKYKNEDGARLKNKKYTK